MKYVFIETYGCAANINNSEIMKGLLKQSGYEITNNPNIAESSVNELRAYARLSNDDELAKTANTAGRALRIESKIFCAWGFCSISPSRRSATS